ncbi:helix-turn-helix domain-containing protein [Microbacterium sp. X-17]|uniref:TetR/AcrR family transcriptional regulator n=1 Tax=Microbacterium sp. X-17 TaxID=3144404 RepID=UPI0031F57B36
MQNPTRRRENTRARLMDAGYAVFAEVGLDAASVEAICERAGFTRGAFYSNFVSKDELFVELATAVAERKLGSVTERVRELRAQDQPPSTIQQIVRAVLDTAVDDPLGVVLMSEVKLRAMRDAETAERYRRWERGVCDRVTGIIRGLAEVYGVRLRVPAEDFARIMLDVWEATATASVIDRLDQEQMRILAVARMEQIAVALVDDLPR